MAFPDRIKRTVDVAHPPHTVWTALTTAEGPGAWFGDEATIDLRPGGPDAVGERAHGADAADRVEEPVVFGFTWPIYGLPEESLGLMAMLVALGVISITWMAVIAVLVLAQKLLPAKTAIDLPLSLAVAGLGVMIVIAPSLVPELSPPM
jgi:uncharacterized protein YndB with AHSA1/START domain